MLSTGQQCVIQHIDSCFSKKHEATKMIIVVITVSVHVLATLGARFGSTICIGLGLDGLNWSFIID